MKNIRKTILDKPKSKWPYWVLFIQTSGYEIDNRVNLFYLNHTLARISLKCNNVPVQIEKQWHSNFYIRGERHRRYQYGVLYKFLNEEDRLLFLLEQENSLS